MPTQETRELLESFGAAVIRYEDAVVSRAPAEELKSAAEEVTGKLARVHALIQRLRATRSQSLPKARAGR